MRSSYRCSTRRSVSSMAPCLSFSSSLKRFLNSSFISSISTRAWCWSFFSSSVVACSADSCALRNSILFVNCRSLASALASDILMAVSASRPTPIPCSDSRRYEAATDCCMLARSARSWSCWSMASLRSCSSCLHRREMLSALAFAATVLSSACFRSSSRLTARARSSEISERSELSVTMALPLRSSAMARRSTECSSSNRLFSRRSFSI